MMTFIVNSKQAQSRLDLFLKENLKEFSRNQIQKWIKRGAALCNGAPAAAAHLLKIGEIVQLSIPKEETAALPEPIPLDILYEDAALLVVNKPAGTLTHPAGREFRGTLANAIAYQLEKESKKTLLNSLRPGIVHRLDKETSGVLVAAKSVPVMENLARQFRERTVLKTYRAIVCGRLKIKRGEIEGPIGKDFRSRKMGVLPHGRYSRTDFKLLKSSPEQSYLEVYPRTGRTHQIRVHLAKIGAPVLGDKIYGKSNDKVPRQMLHAYQIVIRHPVTKKKMKFTAPLPDDFLQTLGKMSGRERPS